MRQKRCDINIRQSLDKNIINQQRKRASRRWGKRNAAGIIDDNIIAQQILRDAIGDWAIWRHQNSGLIRLLQEFAHEQRKR